MHIARISCTDKGLREAPCRFPLLEVDARALRCKDTHRNSYIGNKVIEVPKATLTEGSSILVLRPCTRGNFKLLFVWFLGSKGIRITMVRLESRQNLNYPSRGNFRHLVCNLEPPQGPQELPIPWSHIPKYSLSLIYRTYN